MISAFHASAGLWLIREDGAEYRFFVPSSISMEAEVLELWRNHQLSRVQDAACASAGLMKAYSAAIQAHLDATAKQRHYDSIHTAISYRGDANPQYDAEADALFAWRSAVWAFATAELDKVLAGQRERPEVAEIIAELPDFVWPE